MSGFLASPKQLLLLAAAAVFLPFSCAAPPSSYVDPCREVITELGRADFVPASLAYECLRNVPVMEEISLHAVQQIRLFMQFYSAQTYFAHPPTPELELISVDLNKTLNSIEAKIKAGEYKNDYEINRDLFNLFGAFKDGHVTYYPACYTSFIFRHNFPLISLAKTPQDLPEIYVVCEIDGQTVEVGDKVIKINDKEASSYLADLANTHPELSWVDPDARYNQLLVHRNYADMSRGIFSSRFSYDPNPLRITFENGTTVEVEWVAYSNLDPPSFNDTNTLIQNVCIRSEEVIASIYEYWNFTSTSSTTQISHNPLHPQSVPIASTKDTVASNGTKLSEVGLNIIKYLPGEEIVLAQLNDDTAVLVITSFYPNNIADDLFAFEVTFSNFIADAIRTLQNLNVTQLLIDVSGNGGGVYELGVDVVNQFFPRSNPFFGSDMRWNPALETMMTRGDQSVINGTFWDLGQYFTVDGRPFASFSEFLGPYPRDHDFFTAIALPDQQEALAESGVPIPPFYNTSQPFKAENIILISSGLCASTCALFAEGMQDMGVRSVAFGGRPRVGPMQSVGGTKGSQVLGFDDISGWAIAILGAAVDTLSYIPGIYRINFFAATVNLRNSWRRDDQRMPVEFIYAPAEWKLFFSMEMAKNVTAMWDAAAQVVWGGKGDMSGGV